MKKTMVIIGLLLYAAAHAQSFPYTVTVHLNRLKQPAMVYLVYSFGWSNQRVLDSALLQQGKCILKGQLEAPVKTQLVITRHQEDIRQYIKGADALVVYLENADITVSGTDSAKTAIVTGAAINTGYTAYHTAVLSKTDEAAQKLSEVFKAAPPEKRNEKSFTDSLMLLMKQAGKEKDSLSWRFITACPDQDISLLLLTEMMDNHGDINKIEPVYAKLSERLRHSATGKKLAMRLYDTGPTGVGAMAPDFTMNDTSGQPVTLSGFKGKYVLLDFWASWCGPCRAENPNVVKAYHTYKNKNFTVLSVSLDQPGKKEAWLEAIKKDGLTWTQVSDLQYWNNAAAQLYNIKAIPQNLLIDPQGKIISKNLRGEVLEQKLAALLNK